jgi:hypothetical protein
MVVPCAQLRVFSPRDTLPPGEVQRWASHPTRVGTREARAVEDRVTASRLLTGLGAVPDGAMLVRRVGDVELICPLGYDLRSAIALRQLRHTVPDSVVQMLLPDTLLRHTLDLVGASGRRPSIIDAPWAVPLAWFLLVFDDERRLLDPSEGSGPRLLYATSTERANERISRAVDAIDDTVHGADELLEELAELAEWIETFDPRSLLELDYGGLAPLLGRSRLQIDHSARLAWEAVEALEEGDMLRAAVAHGALRSTWSQSRSLVSAS